MILAANNSDLEDDEACSSSEREDGVDGRHVARHRREALKDHSAIAADDERDTDYSNAASPELSRQWPRSLRFGFPPPPANMKTTSGRYTPQGTRWIKEAEIHWNTHAGADVSHPTARGEWFSYAVRIMDCFGRTMSL